MFLSCLNEISGGCEKIVPVSGGGPLERQKKDSHVYRKTGTLSLIFRKNQSRHYINDEV